MVPSPASFLAALAPEDAEALRAEAVERRYEPGETLLHQDDDPGRVLVLEGGSVRVSHFGGDGRETILAYGRPGDPVGELSAIDGLPRAATVRATEPVRALALSAEAFRALLVARPGIALALLRTLAAKLRAADALRVDQATRNVVGRVASRLTELCDRENTAAGAAPVLVLGQEELAAWAGSSREAASRALQLLRTVGVLDTGRRRIVVLDPVALRRYAS